MPVRSILVIRRVEPRVAFFVHGALRLRAEYGPVEIEQVVRAERRLGVGQLNAVALFVECLELCYVVVLYHKDNGIEKGVPKVDKNAPKVAENKREKPFETTAYSSYMGYPHL
jgi:hypothetical protein